MNLQDVIVATLWLLIFVTPFCLGLSIGNRRGLAKGRALGWQEHYFERVERDRARRQRNGQFKAKEKTA